MTTTDNTTQELDYIIPTKQNPVFQATCDYFGSIELPMYKNALIGNTTTATFALDYIESVARLHEWLKENEWLMKENPKATYEIFSMDGSVDKYGEIVRFRVYSISTWKAKKFIWKK